MIEAFAKFIHDNPVSHVKLILMGNTDDDTKSWIRSINSSDIIILPPASKEESLKIQSQADCLVHFYYPQIHFDTISIKIFEYAMQKKPIICFNTMEGELFNLLENYNLGETTPNDDVQKMSQLFKKAYNNRISYSGDPSLSLKFYNYEYLLLKLIGFIENVLSLNDQK
jgi:glycosyltransferase involved in cell wall biosynthesis